MCFHYHRSVTFHTAVIVGGQKDDQLGNVAQACSVVLEGLTEGQVYHIVHYEDYRECQDEQGALLVVVLDSRVEA